VQLVWSDGTKWMPPVKGIAFGVSSDMIIGAQRDIKRFSKDSPDYTFTLQLCEAGTASLSSSGWSDRCATLVGSKALSWAACEGERADASKIAAEISGVSSGDMAGYVAHSMSGSISRPVVALEDKPAAGQDTSQTEVARAGGAAVGSESDAAVKAMLKGGSFDNAPPKTSGAEKVGVRIGDKSCRMTFNLMQLDADGVETSEENRDVVVQLDFTFIGEITRDNLNY